MGGHQSSCPDGAMLQPFYRTRPDAKGEYDEYFVDRAGAYVRRERVRDIGHALTLRTDILPTSAFLRSFWAIEAKKELATMLATIDMIAIESARDVSL